MPRLVSLISPSQSTSERSAEGGALADTHTRVWRVILNSPGESYDIQSAIGTRIGDPHPSNPDVPCISISERSDGDSRLVRLVTATYRTTPGQGASSGQDPNSQPPDIRPAKYSISSSLIEVPATEWRKYGDVWGPINPNGPFGMGGPVMGVVGQGLGAPIEALNPAKDRYDGITKLVPMINITIEQYDNMPTSRLDDSGKVNNDNFQFLGLQVPQFSCMLRGISVKPTVEAFGDLIYRGFTRTFEFSIKTHGGWIHDVILEGFNIINNGLNAPNVYKEGLSLEHTNGYVKENPLALAAGTEGKKVRAVVPIHGLDGKWLQRPSAMPVALNEDGTPRNVQTANPPVLRHKYCTQGDIAFGNNFANLGVRILEII